MYWVISLPYFQLNESHLPPWLEEERKSTSRGFNLIGSIPVILSEITWDKGGDGKRRKKSPYLQKKNGQSKITSFKENIHTPFISWQDLEPESQNRKPQATSSLSIRESMRKMLQALSLDLGLQFQFYP